MVSIICVIVLLLNFDLELMYMDAMHYFLNLEAFGNIDFIITHIASIPLGTTIYPILSQKNLLS